MSNSSHVQSSVTHSPQKVHMRELVGQQSVADEEHMAVPNLLDDDQQTEINSHQVSSHEPPSSHSSPYETSVEETDTDFVLVDMLDGSHLPTKTERTIPEDLPCPADTQAILSLPPFPNQQSQFSDSSEQFSHARRKKNRSAKRRNALHDINHADTFLGLFPSSRPMLHQGSSAPNLTLNTGISTAIIPPRHVGDTTSVPIPIANNLNPSILARNNAPMYDSIHTHTDSYNWFYDENESDSSTSQSLRSPMTRLRRHNSDQFGKSFRPCEWGWRKPAQEDAIMPQEAWFYLAFIGALTFVIARFINKSSDAISENIIPFLASLPSTFFRNLGLRSEEWLFLYVDTMSLALFRGISLAVAYGFILKFTPYYGAGSGIPEMKCVLGGVLMPQMLNWKTLVGKMCGLIFALSSGISIGRLGPFIHMSCITASLVSKLSVFPELRDNTRFQLQALSAAMAAGVGATLGAPIGGTLLAIEIMVMYYYIHWLPMALYCSIMGYCFIIMFTSDETHAYFTTNANVDMQTNSFARVLVYIVFGALCGVIGAALVHFTTFMFRVRRRYFKNSTKGRTFLMLIMFAVLHTLLGCSLGGVLKKPQKEAVETLFSVGVAPSTQWLPRWWNFFPSEDVNSALALLVVLVLKFVLTGISLGLPIPAGTFMPIFEIGALFGRACGQWWHAVPFFSWLDPRATAIVGAAAVTTGTLHTTAVAVVMMELTREAIDILPLTLGVIVAYGVSKQLCSDLFSELIRVRGLPYLLGLRERYPGETKKFHEEAASEVAGSFMRRHFHFVTPLTTRAEIYEMLTKRGRPWILCAVLSDATSRRLWGTITQSCLWDIVKEDMQVETDGRHGKPEYGTFNASGRGIQRGMETVEFLRNFDPDIGHPLIDMGPMQVSYHTPFWKIATFFQMLSISQMWVVKDGMTVGYLSKADIISHSVKLERNAGRRRRYTSSLAIIREHDEK